MMLLSNFELLSRPVTNVLDRLYLACERTDESIMARVQAEVLKRGAVCDSGVADLLDTAYMPVSREMGMFLYIMSRARQSHSIVEFGTSFGISTIYLAAAVRDNGGGRVITTELSPTKVRCARQNIEEAGLGGLVDFREGDALVTLAKIDGTVDLLLLDGWKDAYLPVVKLVEPRLRAGSVVIADDLDIFPEVHKPYLEYVRSSENGYFSLEIPIGDRIELSLRF
jgi:predicted O-methyltransferase YrrM